MLEDPKLELVFGAMPIRAFLTPQHGFDDEAIRVMGLAFECARSALRISTEDGLSTKIARKIIEFAQTGDARSRRAVRLRD